MAEQPFILEMKRRGVMPTYEPDIPLSYPALGRYNRFTNEIGIRPDARQNPRTLKDVMLHETAHAFQRNTIGMDQIDPTDLAIRQRLNIPSRDDGLKARFQEMFANYLGPQNTEGMDPLDNMVMRSMLNRAFSTNR